MFARLLALVLLAAPALAFAQSPTYPQLFAGGQPPALLNPKLEQRATLPRAASNSSTMRKLRGKRK
jgi:cytochrome c-type biogenesis protein CcmH/NrfG